MKAVIQRVNKAQVSVDNEIVGKINKGILVLLGVANEDTEADMKWLAEKIVNLRIFEDSDEKMNLCLSDVEGELLIVSQFTLFGKCKKGRRPDFTSAGRPDFANMMYEKFISYSKTLTPIVEHGVFGADMKVELENDGPVTLIIDTAE